MRQFQFILALGLAAVTLAGCVKPPGSTNAPAQSGEVEVGRSDLHPCQTTLTDLTDEDCAQAKRLKDAAYRGTAAFTAPKVMFQGQTETLTLDVGLQPAPAPAATAPATPAAAPPPTPAPAPAKAEAPTRAAPDTQPSLGHHHHAHLVHHQANATGAPDEDQPTPGEAAAQAAARNQKVVPYAPFVGARMSARLTGAGFKIEPDAEVVQDTSTNSPTPWQWRVTAQAMGHQTLVLTTAVSMQNTAGGNVSLQPTATQLPVDVWIGPPAIEDALKPIPAAIKWLAAVLAALGALLAALRALRKPKAK